MPLIRGAADAKRIRLSVEVPETQPICRADPQALKQIFLNLLTNAVKFTPEGGAVAVQLRGPAKGIVEFTVRDTGVGIAPAELPRLMKPFEQAARGYSRQNGGSGLGLPLVDSLVRLHGGTPPYREHRRRGDQRDRPTAVSAQHPSRGGVIAHLGGSTAAALLPPRLAPHRLGGPNPIGLPRHDLAHRHRGFT